MKDTLCIGLDCSTTAAKAVAYTAAGEPLAEGRAPLTTHAPGPDMAEQSATAWWEASATALRACAEGIEPERIAALGITVQRETFVLLDRDHAPLRPAILWYDARATALMDELRERLPAAEYHRRTGKQLDTTSALGKLAWLQRHEAAALARTAHLADVLGYLSWRFTGELRTTPAGADTMGLINLQTHRWDDQLLQHAGLSAAHMPELVGAGERLGTLSAAAAEATGLPAGLPIVAGGGDGHCFAFAATHGDSHTATFSLGTSGVLGFSSGAPHLGDAWRTLIGCRRGTYTLESVMQCGSETLRWLHRDLLRATDIDRAIADLEPACAALPPGSEGLLVLPYWRGMRVPTPDPFARGVVLGWSDHHGPAHLQRAIMEGIALEAARLAASIHTACHLPLQRLVVGGGGAASDTWCQILANTFAVEVVRPCDRELAALGAARLAAIGIGDADHDTTWPEPRCTRFTPAAEAVSAYAALSDLQGRAAAGTRHLVAELAPYRSH